MIVDGNSKEMLTSLVRIIQQLAQHPQFFVQLALTAENGEDKAETHQPEDGIGQHEIK
jgi:hypothetical protein